MMNAPVNELHYSLFKRNEEKRNNKIITHEVETIDFMIDNKSLLHILVNEFDGNNDYMGCFSKGWNKLNEESKNKLLLKKEPDTTDGRIMVYVCPECADIGCGALCCKINTFEEFYVWNDFAYENNYEEAKRIKAVGPYYFNRKSYEELIITLSEI
ncbi:MAG: hypothetical protein LBD24_06015 [Spirochaetaceae bacterium]|jgi:hypothetical protein|nr:hypothetical protein [Spirochaetaceae bacterium]